MFYILRSIIRKLPGVVIKTVPLPKPEVIRTFGACHNVGELCAKYGYENVLLVTDQTLFSLKLHSNVVNSLEKSGIKYAIYKDISSEPNIEIIDNGRKILNDSNSQAIIALGGGAVMDSCKIIAAGGRLKKRPTNKLLKKFLKVKNKTLPLISIPTTAGTGAEMTVGAVVTNHKGQKQATVVVGLNVRCVVLDGELTLNAPKNITCACAIDALSHGLEGAVAAVKVPENDVKKSMECVKLVIENLPKVLENPQNIEARQNIIIAANYGGNAINKQLAGYVHAFAHTIGAKYHIPHGNAIAMMLLPVMDFQKRKCLKKLASLSRYCGFADNNETDLNATNVLLEKIQNLIDSCGFEHKYTMKKEDYLTIAHGVAMDSINYSAPIVLKNKDMYQILDAVNK